MDHHAVFTGVCLELHVPSSPSLFIYRMSLHEFYQVTHKHNLTPCSMTEVRAWLFSLWTRPFLVGGSLWHASFYSLRLAPLTTVATTRVSRHCPMPLADLVRITSLEINNYKEKDGIPTLKGDGRRSTMVMC